MAKRETVGKLEVIAISKHEAAQIIALLAGQLADTAILGNQSGAAPTINIMDFGAIKMKIALVLDRELK